MKKVGSSFALLVCLSACGGPQSPQKGDNLIKAHRLYFHMSDCRWNTVQYLGYSARDSYETFDPWSVPEEIWKRYDVLDFLDENGNRIHRGYLMYPAYRSSMDPRIEASDCSNDFFVDVPIKLDLGEVATIKVNDEALVPGPFATKLFKGDLPLLEPDGSIDSTKVLTTKIYDTGSAEDHFDFVILGDGFDAAESPVSSVEALKESAFGKASQKVIESLLMTEPYKSMKDKINVWLVSTPSNESGVDDPMNHITKDSFFGSTFDAWCVDRGLTSKKALRALEVASLAPFDQIIMLLNSKKHGGTNEGALAMFSIDDGFEFTVLHELGHALAGLADKYYYFSDNENVQACKDPHIDEYIRWADHKRRGAGNRPGKKDEDIAPNLTLFGDLAHAKWASLLTPESPVVRFEYPTGPSQFDQTTRTVRWTFSPAQDHDSLLLLSGTSLGTNHAVMGVASQIAVNGQAVLNEQIVRSQAAAPLSERQRAEFKPDQATSFEFWQIPSLKVAKGQKIEVALSYPDDKSAATAAAYPDDANALTIPSQVFDPKALGLFQGANPSLTEVWRSSYVSRMNISSYDYDKVEEQAVRHALETFAGSGSGLSFIRH